MEKQMKKYDIPKRGKKRACLGRADYHWREVKAVDPKGCHSGHLKNLVFLHEFRATNLRMMRELLQD